MSDLISREKVFDVISNWNDNESDIETLAFMISDIPPAEPTLYGYKIEHLAYIARVMEKEGVTAEYAVRTLNDIGAAVHMVMNEVMDGLKQRWRGEANER